MIGRAKPPARLFRMKGAGAPLWRCRRCGRVFANRNQSHSCVRRTLRDFLADKDPRLVALFRKFEAIVRRCGPVRANPVKSRITFQVRMNFVGAAFRRDGLHVGLVLARRIESPRFARVIAYSPRNVYHAIVVRRAADLDGAFAGWVREAYAVGGQRHRGLAPTRPA